MCDDARTGRRLINGPCRDRPTGYQRAVPGRRPRAPPGRDLEVGHRTAVLVRVVSVSGARWSRGASAYPWHVATSSRSRRPRGRQPVRRAARPCRGPKQQRGRPGESARASRFSCSRARAPVRSGRPRASSRTVPAAAYASRACWRPGGAATWAAGVASPSASTSASARRRTCASSAARAVGNTSWGRPGRAHGNGAGRRGWRTPAASSRLMWRCRPSRGDVGPRGRHPHGAWSRDSPPPIS